ncbi:hypothetical protein BGX24_011256 [Mortierella sp. AD032]|nr:hypothetical protein BGX24_011256 [Mortierella sp. AD032]
MRSEIIACRMRLKFPRNSLYSFADSILGPEHVEGIPTHEGKPTVPLAFSNLSGLCADCQG